MKRMKKTLSLLLVVACLLSLFGMGGISASAVQTSNPEKYTIPTGSDYAYWNGSKMVKASTTNKSKVQWMQAALNYCIDNKVFSGKKLEEDGSFGPATKTATLAFQKSVALKQDGKFGPDTIAAMKKKIDEIKKGKNSTNITPSSATSTSKKLLWPVASKYNISGKYGTNRKDHIHAGIDIGTQGAAANIYAVADGEVVNVKTSTSGARGRYVIVYHKDLGYTSLYQHCSSITVKKGDKVKQGDVIAKVGGSGYNKENYYAFHCHFELATGKRTASGDAVSKYRINPTPGVVVTYSNKK